jgi:hypothetical protein
MFEQFEHACCHVGHSDTGGYMFEHACRRVGHSDMGEYRFELFEHVPFAIAVADTGLLTSRPLSLQGSNHHGVKAKVRAVIGLSTAGVAAYVQLPRAPGFPELEPQRIFS